MKIKGKLGLLICGAVAVMILITALILTLISGRTQEETVQMEESEAYVYALETGLEDEEVESDEPIECVDMDDFSVVYRKAEVEYAAENGYLTLDEANALSVSELGAYLDGVYWDAEFQEYVNETYEDVKDILASDPYYYHKLYLSEHPEITISGFGNPYADNEALFEETYMSLQESRDSQGSYINSTVSLTYNGNGDTVSLGTVNPKNADGIYLVPACSTATEFEQVGFYITRNSNLLASDYDSDSEVFYEDTRAANGIVYADNSNYIRSGEYYENLHWVDVSRAIGGQICEEDTLYLRMVKLENNELLGVFRAVISHDSYSDSYYISGLFDDGAKPGSDSLTEEDFNDLTTAAVTALRDGTLSFSTSIGEDQIETVAENCIVEFVPKTYFAQFTNLYYEKSSLGDICTQGTVACAVNVPVTGLGAITVYLVPYGNLLQSERQQVDTVYGSMSWALVGLDVPALSQ